MAGLPTDEQSMLNWALGLLATLVMFFTKALHGRVAKIDTRQTDHEKEVALHYLLRRDYNEGLNRIADGFTRMEKNSLRLKKSTSSSLRRIHEKLDRKVDK